MGYWLLEDTSFVVDYASYQGHTFGSTFINARKEHTLKQLHSGPDQRTLGLEAVGITALSLAPSSSSCCSAGMVSRSSLTLSA